MLLLMKKVGALMNQFEGVCVADNNLGDDGNSDWKGKEIIFQTITVISS